MFRLLNGHSRPSAPLNTSDRTVSLTPTAAIVSTLPSKYEISNAFIPSSKQVSRLSSNAILWVYGFPIFVGFAQVVALCETDRDSLWMPLTKLESVRRLLELARRKGRCGGRSEAELPSPDLPLCGSRGGVGTARWKGGGRCQVGGCRGVTGCPRRKGSAARGTSRREGKAFPKSMRI